MVIDVGLEKSLCFFGESNTNVASKVKSQRNVVKTENELITSAKSQYLPNVNKLLRIEYKLQKCQISEQFKNKPKYSQHSDRTTTDVTYD
ncbi:hypothetical protein H5410_039962 [Solanum commersonii]|uniref:Uncharacterized protein n=1 Tax=Solanum commersonii TaxID=4109 RepID=A0A9J5XQQ7_SOLCO|nr:hypothetical protein H5410_039962 [Solanum commersonii]